MNHRSFAAFNYNFRTPGSSVDGPIGYASGQTSLGTVLIGHSSRGVCAILLGDDAQALHKELAESFPKAGLKADQGALQHELDQVIAFIEQQTTDGIIDLDVGGTRFEQKVWNMLRGIPEGETRSYGEVAKDLGSPDAARAVAGACAANVLAIAIPCHRVVRSDGSLSGYRWGANRKLQLLGQERAQ